MKSSESQIVIPIPTDSLGEFILGLLGQTRRISRLVKQSIIAISHDNLVSLTYLVEQRLSQNPSKLASFRGEIFFEDGKIIELNSPEAVRTFSDNSQAETTGLRLNYIYLVKFGDRDIPEKQEINIEIFSNYSNKNEIQNKNEDIKEQEPAAYYEIKCTNVTFGNDLAANLDTFFGCIILNFWLEKTFRFLESKAGAAVGLAFAMIASFAWTSRFMYQKVQTLNEKVVALRAANDTYVLNYVNALIDYHRQTESGVFLMVILGPILFIFVGTFLLDRLSKLFLRSFVVLNPYSSGLKLKNDRNKRFITGFVFITIFIGILVNIFSSRIDKYFFG